MGSMPISSADSPAPADATSAQRSILTFQLGRETWGTDLELIHEIIKIEESSICLLYHVAPFLLGVTNLRGQIKPVIDLATFVGVKADLPARRADVNGERSALVLARETPEIICLVDRIGKVVRCDEDSLRPVENAAEQPFIAGVAVTDREPIQILNVDSVLGANAWESYR